MSHAEIVGRFVQGGFFVVEAEHFHDDGSFWYMEHYRFSVMEGHKRKRATNDAGEALLDDDTVAPVSGVGMDRAAFLPPGRAWKRLPPPHMDDSSIWEVISLDHKTRRLAGYPGGRNTLGPGSGVPDQAGADVLMTRFANIIGRRRRFDRNDTFQR